MAQKPCALHSPRRDKWKKLSPGWCPLHSFRVPYYSYPNCRRSCWTGNMAKTVPLVCPSLVGQTVRWFWEAGGEPSPHPPLPSINPQGTMGRTDPKQDLGCERALWGKHIKMRLLFFALSKRSKHTLYVLGNCWVARQFVLLGKEKWEKFLHKLLLCSQTTAFAIYS